MADRCAARAYTEASQFRAVLFIRESGSRWALTDAWLAALAIEHGCEWITFDRDFARFTGLRWSEPE